MHVPNGMLKSSLQGHKGTGTRRKQHAYNLPGLFDQMATAASPLTRRTSVKEVITGLGSSWAAHSCCLGLLSDPYYKQAASLQSSLTVSPNGIIYSTLNMHTI